MCESNPPPASNPTTQKHPHQTPEFLTRHLCHNLAKPTELNTKIRTSNSGENMTIRWQVDEWEIKNDMLWLTLDDVVQGEQQQ